MPTPAFGFNAISPTSPQSVDANSFFAIQTGQATLGPTFSLNLENAPENAEALLDDLSFPVVIDYNNGSGISEKSLQATVVKISPRPPSLGTPVLYYQVGLHDWRPVPYQKVVNNSIVATLKHLGYYQVFAPIINLPFSFAEVYVFPNPTKGGQVPTLHVEIGQADEVSTRIYDVAGDLVFEGRVDSKTTVVNGKSAYEHALNPDLFKSGVYIGVVTATKAGKETVRKRYRFTIVK